MIQHELNTEKGILVLKPMGPLEAEDFSAIMRETDSYIEEQGALNGLLIVAKKFPGWEDVQGFVAHVKFVRDHHKKIKKVAFVSDSKFFEFVPRLADHFVSAEVKHFGSVDEKSALGWLSA
jgi:hypothetical protein